MDPKTELSPQEIVALEKLKERIQDVIPKLKNDFWRLDLNLAKFLRARDLNVVKAEEMIRATLQWRAKNQVDPILNEAIPLNYFHDYPFRFFGPDKEGHLGVDSQSGKLDLRKAAENKEEFLRYFIFFMEHCCELNRVHSGPDKIYNQVVMILDMGGFSILQFLSRNVLFLARDLIQIFDSNYPEFLQVCYIVNAPKIFELFWSIVKPLLAARTLSKVSIFSSDTIYWRNKLRGQFHPENLLSDYGGAMSTVPIFMPKDGPDVFREYPLRTMDKEVLVPARDKFEVDVVVELPNSKLFWNFGTQDYDIGFQVNFQESQVLVDYCRVDSHIATQRGLLLCKEAGKYSLIFDNSFSSFKSKQLRYICWTD